MQREFEWNAAFSVGHELLDKQHQQLLGLCKQARDCANDNREGFHKVLNDLAQFAMLHFQSEESVLKECKYAGLEAQEKEHVDFMVKIMDFLSDAMARNEDRVAFADFAWLW
jgi:hemerythrin